MPELRGLDCVKGAIAVQYVKSIDHAIERIQRRRAVTAAGDTGALNIWRDDQKRLRSHFMRHRVTLNEAEHADLDSLRRWLNKWWPQLGRDVDARNSK